MKLEFDITEVVIASLGDPDEIRLKYGDQKWIHITTQQGNGESCLHELGWRGEYAYISISAGAETRQMLDVGGHGMTVRNDKRLRAKVRELTWPASMTQADMQELKEGVEARKRLIKDLSPEERAKLARELREWREVID